MNKTAFYQSRRTIFAEHIGNGMAIVPTARECLRNRGNPYPYRPDSSFWYLTGFPEPEAMLVIANGRSILFCREKDAEQAIWTGFCYGPAAAREAFGFDEALPISDLETKLLELMGKHPRIWHSFGVNHRWDTLVLRLFNKARDQALAGGNAPIALLDWKDQLGIMRLIKDEAEIAQMRRAAEITAAGHLRALKTCQAGMTEYALEAELGCEFRRLGANGYAYNPIVAGGRNACVLHYTQNDRVLADGELVLIDAGCEFDCYAADVTRTLPVNGKFTAAQKDCYEIVLAAQETAIAATRPGAAFNLPHEAAVRTLTEGMRTLGLLEGDIDGLIESGAYRRFYMHHTGHWLGLDVHDAGPWKKIDLEGKTSWPMLAPGMTLTCEPGLYIAPAPDVPDALSGIGIRIEDNLLITESGCEVYTAVPKSVAEIEAAMKECEPEKSREKP